MAPPASKKRKTEHVSSGDDASEASFASFSDEDTYGGVGLEHGTSGVDSAEEIDVDGDDEVEAGQNDDEEDTEDGDDAQAGAEMSKGAKLKSTRQDNGKPPTKSSRNAQSGTSAYVHGTFKSNVFKLQVDELLAQIRPKHGKREAAAEAALHSLKKTIEHIPARGPFLSADAERDLIKQKIAVPFPDPRPPKDAKYKFAYAKPANINVVGSFALKTSTRSREILEVDMMVTMPGSLFEEKDYLNLRYFYKRAFYLSCVAAGLKSAHKSEYSLRYTLFHDNPLKPILVLAPIGQKSDALESVPAPKWRINIIPCIAETQFPVDKLQPDRNCVRNSSGTSDHVDHVQVPTLFYNSSLRSDMLMTSYLKLLHAASKSCEAFVDACMLGSTWLRQRGFESSIHAGGFGNFEWAALMALCLTGGGSNGRQLLSQGYSSYQLFKATVQLLAVRDFVKQPLLVGDTPDAPKSADGLPLVWDVERAHNLFFKVPQWSYRLLKQESKSTLNALGDQLHDGFDATFILRVHDPLYRYDHVLELPQKSLSTGESNLESTFAQARLRELYRVLKQGLGDRVNQIRINQPALPAWQLGSSTPKESVQGNITVGLLVNPENVRRTVDHGPSAENKAEAAEFRKFWGEKAELRRFKDGSILESLVWASPQESGHTVLEQIVRYLLSHRFALVSSDELRFHGDGFPKFVRGGSERTPFEHMMASYKKFETDIRTLEDLPLSIRSIMPADAQLRYASMRPPFGGKLLYRATPADVVLQFEGSARWPDDLGAIQRTKIAFLLKLNELLMESVSSITTRIGLENEGQDVLNQGFLDVTYDSEATFRLRIYHEREQTLHERVLKDKSVDPKSREVSALGLAKYKRDYIKSPAHTQAISRLCTRHAPLSGSIRLTKRWFASHLLTHHIADEVIELLVARTFTHPFPWQTPSSVQTGFLRTLFWISRWDWRAEPLVVDLSGGGELKQAGMQSIRTNFEAWRKLDPAMNRVALFAASNVDADGVTWTDENKPAKVVAGRMTALAKAACAEVAEKQLSLEPASLFTSPLEDFDFALHLSTDKKKTNGFKNLELKALQDTDMIGYEPVQSLLAELEDVYGSAVLFFNGGSEQDVIAGLWSPVTARRAWKVNLAYSTIPRGEDQDTQADLNKSAMLSEIARLGGDLIEKVEIFQK
ncbi:Hypothetical predicted protein [Lecanosticta acicola]|uniref:U3 small nucleolar RNA-associated protein 22 n=1 Tax=Lecanosticta acicola TaxID=111012 RepID=A0AAI8Z6X8_9PEZI|nr:Hypothetical predicted protein [Lecanosticta acicola]